MKEANSYVKDGMVVELFPRDERFIEAIRKSLCEWDPAGLQSSGHKFTVKSYGISALGILLMIKKHEIYYGDDLNEDYFDICHVLPEKRHELPKFQESIKQAIEETNWFLISGLADTNLRMWIVKFDDGMQIAYNANQIEPAED